MFPFPAPNLKGPNFFSSAAEIYGYPGRRSCGQPGIFLDGDFRDIYVYNIPQPGKKYPAVTGTLFPSQETKIINDSECSAFLLASTVFVEGVLTQKLKSSAPFLFLDWYLPMQSDIRTYTGRKRGKILKRSAATLVKLNARNSS
jgi:hypothetical protein